MGYMKHDIVILEVSKESLKVARRIIDVLSTDYKRHFKIHTNTVNHLNFICIFPDGNKEGWDHSDEMNEIRKDFIDEFILKEGTELVHLQFGGDDDIIEIIQTTDKGIKINGIISIGD